MAGHREMALTGPELRTRIDQPAEVDRLRMIASAVSRAIRNRRPRPTLRCPHQNANAGSQGRIRTASLSLSGLGTVFPVKSLEKHSSQLSDRDRSRRLKFLNDGDPPIAGDEVTNLEDTLLIEQTRHGCFGG